MGTMHLSCLPTRANTLSPQGWASYRPFLRSDGWPGIGSVWHKSINTPFTPNTRSIIASSSRHNPFKYCSRCSGVSTKTCGADGQTLILQKLEPQGACVQPFYSVWVKSLRVDEEGWKLIQPADPPLAFYGLT